MTATDDRPPTTDHQQATEDGDGEHALQSGLPLGTEVLSPQSSITRAGFLASFRYAIAGLVYSFRTQRNFRIHIVIAILAVVMGLVLGLSWVEWAIVAVLVVVVLSAEMVNTMVEALVDLVTQEYHPLAKVAKDVAAGVVLLSAIGSVVVGVLIFGPKLITLLVK